MVQQNIPADMSPQEIINMQKENCIFCKIIHGEIPSKKLYEDDRCSIILDINPANEGHLLLLPKVHYQIMPQIPPDEIAYLFKIAQKASLILLRGLSVKGTSVFVANGAVAGQKSPHFLIHIIPRTKGDSLFIIPKQEISQEELIKTQKLILQRMGGSTLSQKKERTEEKNAFKDVFGNDTEKKSGGKKSDIDLDQISGLFD